MNRVTFGPNGEIIFPQNHYTMFSEYPSYTPTKTETIKKEDWRDVLTLISGFHTEDGIVMASDSRGLHYGVGKYDDKVKKVRKIDDRLGVCCSGISAINSSIILDFRRNINNIKGELKVEFIRDCLLVAIKGYIERTTVLGKPNLNGLEIIVGGYAQNIPMLCSIGYHPKFSTGIDEHIFDRENNEFIAVGGTMDMVSIFHDYYQDKFKKLIKIDEAIPIIKQGIEELSEKRWIIGGEPQIAKITEDGGFEWVNIPKWMNII